MRHEAKCSGVYQIPQDKIRKCSHCKEIFDISTKPKGFMANHSRWCDENPKIYNNQKSVAAMNESKTNSGFSNQFTKAKISSNITLQSQLKGRRFSTNKAHSSEHKLKISSSIKKFLIDNPEKHVWKRADKFVSVPCENFKSFLRNKGIDFVSEFTPLLDRNYSIDIAFPDIKIGIEINGNQHYQENKLSEYYQERHDAIEASGWKLYEFRYNLFFTDENMMFVLENIPELALSPGLEPET